MTSFNPRAPRVGRDNENTYVMQWESVSIHAPARGATYLTKGNTWIIIRFNPRAREGRARQLGTAPSELVRVVSIHAPREGRDLVNADFNFVGISVSIHAPARGATAA